MTNVVNQGCTTIVNATKNVAFGIGTRVREFFAKTETTASHAEPGTQITPTYERVFGTLVSENTVKGFVIDATLEIQARRVEFGFGRVERGGNVYLEAGEGVDLGNVVVARDYIIPLSSGEVVRGRGYLYLGDQDEKGQSVEFRFRA